ncbi:MAG TPA: SprT family zinc-dependent metalloprotease [Planctomycetota bacterium]|nr:SprT family zinc-dependent metalloprotease [Planctomycetota bacterium]
MQNLEVREIQLDGRCVSYTLRRSARARYLRADIGLRTGLRVTLPDGLNESRIETFLRARQVWVLRALGRLERLAALIPDRTLDHGTTVPYLGAQLTLNLSNGVPARVGRLGDSLIVHTPRRTRAAVHSALVGWYREEAARVLSGHARALAARHNLDFKKIIIRDQRRRWGSCSSKGTLFFNWRLMLGPEGVARYLVAHELAHRAHPDHSRRFWAKVAELCPDFREQERWLKKNGVALVL